MLKKVIYFIAIILGLLILCVIIYNRNPFVGNYSIASNSMAPSLVKEDIIRVKKNVTKPQRGEVYLYKHPVHNSDYIFRIIGLPNDKIQLIEGRLYINNVVVERKLLEKSVKKIDDKNDISEYIEYLPDYSPIHIYEENDNGLLDNTPIYTVPEDHYFMMGDNRDNSADSRLIDQHGFVPIENFIGRPTYFVFSNDENKIGTNIFK